MEELKREREQAERPKDVERLDEKRRRVSDEMGPVPRGSAW
jgi:hypothetical protein